MQHPSSSRKLYVIALCAAVKHHQNAFCTLEREGNRAEGQARVGQELQGFLDGIGARESEGWKALRSAIKPFM